MAHSIRVYICEDDGSFDETPHLNLPQGFLLFLDKPKNFKQNRIVAKIETDYFGGCGDQFAKVWDNGVKMLDERGSYGPINEALAYLGVKCENNQDEFDALGLGAYRDQETLSRLIYDNI